MMRYSSLTWSRGQRQPEVVWRLMVSFGMFTRDDFTISFTSTTAVTSWHLAFTSLTLARMTGEKKTDLICMMAHSRYTMPKKAGRILEKKTDLIYMMTHCRNTMPKKARRIFSSQFFSNSYSIVRKEKLGRHFSLVKLNTIPAYSMQSPNPLPICVCICVCIHWCL